MKARKAHFKFKVWHYMKENTEITNNNREDIQDSHQEVETEAVMGPCATKMQECPHLGLKHRQEERGSSRTLICG